MSMIPSFRAPIRCQEFRPFRVAGILYFPNFRIRFAKKFQIGCSTADSALLTVPGLADQVLLYDLHKPLEGPLCWIRAFRVSGRNSFSGFFSSIRFAPVKRVQAVEKDQRPRGPFQEGGTRGTGRGIHSNPTVTKTLE